MLKFLDDRTHEVPRKSPKKYKPEMLYGISLEAPQEFQHPHTIVKKDTYVNPYLNFQEKRMANISPEDKKNVSPKWKQKINVNLVQEQKIVSSVPQLVSINKISSRYVDNFYNGLNTDSKRFHITRGQFTNFIQKNNHYKSMGPMQGIQRSEERIRNTLKSVWAKTSKSRQGSTILSSSFNSSLKKSTSSCSNNSKLITQKTRIRFNRQNFNSLHKNSFDQRKKNKLNLFQLPKIGSQIVTVYNKNTVGIFGRDIPSQSQDDRQVKFLQTFSDNLAKKFK